VQEKPAARRVHPTNLRDGVSTMKTRRVIGSLLLASLLAVTVLDAAGPGPSERAAYRVFLPIVRRQYQPPEPCLPLYSDYEFLFRIDEDDDMYETFPTRGDFNADGLDDIVIARLQWLTYAAYELDILLNDGSGGMFVATPDLFSGPVPAVQHPSQVLVADFNGDGRSDIFVANSGYDDNPFPGYQNTLVLSTPDGKLVDACQNLPQQEDMSHSAAAADIDGDGDVDLYVGNVWAGNMIPPQILLNDGGGRLTVAANQNGFTVCEFCDVNSDGFPDLILGDAGDDIDLSHEYTTRTSEVLLNNGAGVFTWLRGALPAKDSSPYDKATDIEAIDLNCDGYMDLLIVYQRQPSAISYAQTLINNGDGTFRNESAARLGAFDRLWITNAGVVRPVLELQDVDRDGDLDLWGNSWDLSNPEPLLWLNNGSGVLRHQPFSFGLRNSDWYFAFVDMEGDGGHDVLLTLNFPPDHVFVIRDLGCRPITATSW
jgi:hypothetical protein